MDRLGYDVSNIGERDVRQGYARFAERTRDSKMRFISANIVDKATQKPIFDSHAIVEVASPDGSQTIRIGLIGVVRFNPVFQKDGPEGQPMAIVHPVERVREEVAALQAEQVDQIVLLGALHRDDSKRIVAAVPGIDFVIGSYGGLFTSAREQEGQTWILYSGNQGKRLGSTRVYLGDAGEVVDQETRLHFMTERYPADPEMLEFVASAPIDRSAPTAAAQGQKPRVPLTRHFVGSGTCMDCHKAEYDQWNATAHATAMQTLQNENEHESDACVSCHSTGFGKPNGFKSVATTPHLGSVGCESCHGAGAMHAKRPRRGYGKVNAASCGGCHTSEQSPDFDYYTDLAVVDHTTQSSRATSEP